MYRQAFLVTARSFTRARSSHKLLRVVAIARQHACVSVYSVACVANDEMHAYVCDHANVRDAYNHAPSISRPRCFHTIRPYQNVRMRLCLYRIFLCLLPLLAFPSPVFLSLSLSLFFFYIRFSYSYFGVFPSSCLLLFPPFLTGTYFTISTPPLVLKRFFLFERRIRNRFHSLSIFTADE